MGLGGAVEGVEGEVEREEMERRLGKLEVERTLGECLGRMEGEEGLQERGRRKDWGRTAVAKGWDVKVMVSSMSEWAGILFSQ